MSMSIAFTAMHWTLSKKKVKIEKRIKDWGLGHSDTQSQEEQGDLEKETEKKQLMR